mgnify:CR=1 FL=1
MKKIYMVSFSRVFIVRIQFLLEFRSHVDWLKSGI